MRRIPWRFCRQGTEEPLRLGRAGYFIGIDLGTITLAAQLTEGKSRELLSASTMVNPQRAYGADVISRIKASPEGKGEELKRMIRESMRTLILQVIQGVRPERRKADESLAIEGIDIAGNTTMILSLP
ncbi:uncharacterized 2Fe-2S/4Fe-4S cluster protein (DUF4445 family) [Anaerotaenia torta]|uniref:hypothetical protein n=1 Tax=Anaerotaenia torta TaxID=433293 RepID=UPI003D20A135